MPSRCFIRVSLLVLTENPLPLISGQDHRKSEKRILHCIIKPDLPGILYFPVNKGYGLLQTSLFSQNLFRNPADEIILSPPLTHIRFPKRQTAVPGLMPAQGLFYGQLVIKGVNLCSIFFCCSPKQLLINIRI